MQVLAPPLKTEGKDAGSKLKLRNHTAILHDLSQSDIPSVKSLNSHLGTQSFDTEEKSISAPNAFLRTIRPNGKSPITSDSHSGVVLALRLYIFIKLH